MRLVVVDHVVVLLVLHLLPFAPGGDLLLAGTIAWRDDVESQPFSLQMMFKLC